LIGKPIQLKFTIVSVMTVNDINLGK